MSKSGNFNYHQLRLLSILVDKYCDDWKSDFCYDAEIFARLWDGEKMVIAISNCGTMCYLNPSKVQWYNFPSRKERYQNEGVSMIYTYRQTNPKEVKKTYLVVKGESIKEIHFADTLKVLGLD